MPSPKRRKPYNFVYDDKTVLTYELTNDDFKEVTRAAKTNERFAVVSIGLISLFDLRTAVEQKELTEKEKKAEKEYLESAVAGLDEATIEWLNQQRELLEKYNHDALLEDGKVELI